jgi:peptide/nickel transport system substrate-binding protein
LDTTRQYHNGTKVSAYDFEYVLIKPFITKLPTVNERIPLAFIKGISKLQPGMKFKSGMAEGIKVIDDKTVDVYIPSGSSRFLYALGPQLPPLAPISTFKDDHYTFKDNPIGAGPYKVVYSDPKGSMVRVEKVGNVSGPKTIEFYTDKRAFENRADIALGGGISGMRSYVNEHPTDYSLFQTKLPDSIEVLVFNFQTTAAMNDNFRKAVMHAIDNSKEIQGFTAQISTDQVIPVLSYGYQKPELNYNLSLAKKLFDSLPADIKSTEHVLVCHGSPDFPPGKYYEAIFNDLKAIGMNVKLVLSEDISFKDGDSRTTMSVFGRYIDSDPLSSFSYYLPGTSNEALTPNPEYAKTFGKAEEALSIQDKVEYIKEMTRIIKEKALVVPMHQRYSVYYVSPRINAESLIRDTSTFDVTNIEIAKK